MNGIAGTLSLWLRTAEESERLLKVLVAKAQNSIEASRALISKLDEILRVKQRAPR